MTQRDKVFGVVTSDDTVASQFDTVFFETKNVAGEWNQPTPRNIPMVCCFADGNIAQTNPHWIQKGQNGELATRYNKYFNYDWLCPSHAGVREQAMKWVKKAISSSFANHIRLDNVCFAREHFCSCSMCDKNRAESGKNLLLYRQDVITNFVSECRSMKNGKLFVTLYPDPYPKHLENRFGMSIERLKPLVDVFVVPIFDLNYGTTYWLETLAMGFADLFCGHPWYIELYGDGIEESRLRKAAQVANAYADGVLLAYGKDIGMMKIIERHLREK